MSGHNSSDDVLEILRTFPEGLTTTEMGELLDKPAWSVSPRIAPLVRSGDVVDTGRVKKHSLQPSRIWAAVSRDVLRVSSLVDVKEFRTDPRTGEQYEVNPRTGTGYITDCDQDDCG